MRNYFEKIRLNWSRHGIWAILVLASVLRFKGLVRRDLWYDEAFTGVTVKENFGSMIEMIINDVHPPLYYIFLKGFSFFFDYSVYGLRLFSAIFGLASIWALYMLAKELFDARVGRYAALIGAISPLAIQYSQEARMYAMLVFCILIASYFFVKGLKTNQHKYFVWWGIFTGFSMLTHYIGIIFSALYYPAFVIWNLSDNGSFDGKKLKQKFSLIFQKCLPIKNLIAGYIFGLIVFLPWLKNFLYHLSIKGENLSWVKPATLGDFATMIQMFLFGTPLGELSSGMPQPNELSGIAHDSIRMALAMGLAVIVWQLWSRKARKQMSIALLFSLGFMLVIYFLSVTMADQQYFVARYILPGAFFFFIFVGFWLSRLRWQIVAGIFASYLLLISMIIPLANSKGYNEMILHLDRYKNNDFYILNSFDYVIAKYYLGDEKLTLYNYDWPGYNPDFWAAIGKGLKRSENFDDLKNNPRALVISNKPLTRDNQYFSTQNLVLVDQYKNILVYKFQR